MQLREVSGDADPHFDSKVFIAPGDKAAKDRLAELPVFVPAAELDKAKQEAAAAKAAAGRDTESREDARKRQYRSQYPGTLHFDYTWDKSKGKELGLAGRYGATTSSPICAAVSGDACSLRSEGQEAVAHQLRFRNGLYTVPKELDNGYLAIGKQKVEFHRTEETR